MSSTSQKIDGAADRVSGKTKEVVGSATGNKTLEAKGKAQNLVGKAKIEGAKAAEHIKEKTREVADRVEDKLDAITDAAKRKKREMEEKAKR